MSEEQHIELGEVLNECVSKVAVSGYPSDLYNTIFKSWRRVEFDIANHAAGGRKKARKRETLWLNW
jgi:DNA adenine methylase